MTVIGWYCVNVISHFSLRVFILEREYWGRLGINTSSPLQLKLAGGLPI